MYVRNKIDNAYVAELKTEIAKRFAKKDVLSDGQMSIRINSIWKEYTEANARYGQNLSRIQEMHRAIGTLEQLGYCTLKRGRGSEFYSTMAFSKSQVEVLLHETGVVDPKRELHEATKKAFLNNRGKHTEMTNLCIETVIGSDFRGYIFELPKETASANTSATDYEEYYEELFRVMDAIFTLTEDVFLRNLSVRICGNSKVLEKQYLSKMCMLIRTTDPLMNELTDLEILEQYHIHKTPSMVLLRGYGSIELNNGMVVSLDSYQNPIALTSEQVHMICRSEIENIITVENETTMYSIPVSDQTCLVYTEGFPSDTVIQCLRVMIEQNSIEKIQHFSDLDPYGFYIWRSLRGKLPEVDVQTYRMDTDTYLENEARAMKMLDSHRRTLSKMLDDDYYSEDQKQLFRLMLDKGKTLEQEGIEF